MVVSPQLFNYRLIIGSLAIVIVALGSYSLSSYNTLKKHRDILENENVLIQNELTEILDLYETTSHTNVQLQNHLNQTKRDLKITLDSLQVLKANVVLLSKYKSRLTRLKQQHITLVALVDSIKNHNHNVKSKLEHQHQIVKTSQEQLSALTLENQKLQQTINKVALLKIANIQVRAFKVESLKHVFETTKAHKANHIEVCFTLLENKITPKGSKNIYVQILAPNGNIIAEKEQVKFNNKSLSYSGKTTVNHLNNRIDICTKINVTSTNSLSKGEYLVNIYQNAEFLGKASLKLY